MELRSLLLAIALAIPNAHALLRFSCAQLVTERFDPLVTPSLVSPHLHQIVGGNAFNITMDPNNDLPALSTCTTCTFSEDFSNYWTAVMFFKHPNGTYKRVPQIPAAGTGAANGGMTVYYIQGTNYQGFYNADSTKLTAFKKGFRMIVGDAMQRALDSNLPESKALTFRCFESNQSNILPMPGEATSGTRNYDTNHLPTKACAGGIRAQIYFPTCWNGKDLDSPDHKTHVAYKVNGKCPDTHSVVLPQLFLETLWDTSKLNSLWTSGMANPYVYSMGDPQGFGQHADYVFGWKDDTLQRAMDTCKNTGGGNCAALKTQSNAQANKCTQTPRVDEPVEGWIAKLPGCNPIQDGPGRAVPQDGCGAPSSYLPGKGPNGL